MSVALQLAQPSTIAKHETDDHVRSYVRSSKAKATRIGYSGDFARFERWCDRNGFASLPARPETVCRYVAARALEGKRTAHIRRELAGIAFFHRERAIDPNPASHPAVKATVQGIARTHSYSPKKAPAILPDDLLRMVETLDLRTIRGARDASILTLGWIGAFRRSELAALNLEHVSVTERGLLVDVVRQKNHQAEAQTKEAVLASEPKLCATLALKRWLRFYGRDSGPLFCSVAHGGHLRPSVRIAGQTVNRIVQRTAAAAGLEPMGFTAHSLRSGYVTASFRAGKDATVISQQTGHKSLNTLAGYARRAHALGEQSPTVGLL